MAKWEIDPELEEESKFLEEANLDNNPSTGPVTVG